jgi:hypothetical protein
VTGGSTACNRKCVNVKGEGQTSSRCIRELIEPQPRYGSSDSYDLSDTIGDRECSHCSEVKVRVVFVFAHASLIHHLILALVGFRLASKRTLTIRPTLRI